MKTELVVTQLLTPVVLFAYNRPMHFERALDALSQTEGAGVTPLWIFCDGPKFGQDTSDIRAVRDVAVSERWRRRFASVETVFAATNKGLARSVIDGVSHVIERTGKVIVLEDDLIVAPDYLRFMNDCLDFYEECPEIGMVTGFSPIHPSLAGYQEYVYAVPRNCSYGWGTWRDRWRQIEWGADETRLIWRDGRARRAFTRAGPDQIFRLWRMSRGEIDSWSIRVDVWLASTERLTIYPVDNRVMNIGYDGSGVHCAEGEAVNNYVPREALSYRLARVKQNQQVNEAFCRIYGGSFLRRAIRSLRDLTLFLRGR